MCRLFLLEILMKCLEIPIIWWQELTSMWMGDFYQIELPNWTKNSYFTVILPRYFSRRALKMFIFLKQVTESQ